tara:strand:+ start:5465 stop:8248 length:2784 start_codon:yes stop_codon:yes gene_type:complete
MATSDKLNEINDLLRKISQAYDTLGDENPFRNFNKKPIEDADAAIKQLQIGLDGVKSRIQGTTDSFSSLYGVLREISKEINPKIFSSTKLLEGGMKGMVKEAQKLKFEEEGINRLNEDQLKKLKTKFKEQQSIAKTAAEEIKSQFELVKFKNKSGKEETRYRDVNTKKFVKLTNAQRSALGILDDENDILGDILLKVSQRIRQEQEVTKAMGAAPAILEGIGKALQKIGLPDFGIKGAIEESKAILVAKQKEYDENAKLGKEDRKRVSAFQALSTTSKQIGKNIAKQLTFANALQGGFTMLVSAMVSTDKATGALAKNIGVSYKESLGLQKEFNQIAMSSDNIMVSSAALNKSFASLNQQFQGTTNFSKETLESFTALTAQAGFSEETIGNITKLTGAQGNEINDNVALLQGELSAMNAVNGTTFSTKQMLEDIGKINKSTLLILNQQPQALAKTLYTSKKLGLSFAEMESISSSMLDFESSIQNELEAELLTGKNLNLEQARLLALKGDVAGASAEIAKQVGSAEKFGKMNVIQQESLAKAVGLTKDQLANSLIEQEAIAALSEFEGKTAREKYENAVALYGEEEARRRLGNDILAQQMDSQSNAERFGAAVERIKELFINVGEAIMPAVSLISNFAGGVAKLVTKFPLLTQSIVAAGLGFKIINAFSGGVLSNQLKINAASKLGLITKQQEGLILKGNLATDVAAAENLNGINIAKKLGLISEEQQALLKKGSLATDIASNTAEKVNNTLSATGNKIEKRGLLAKIGGAVTSAMETVFSGPGKLLGPFAIPLALAAGAAIGAIGYSFMKDGKIDPKKGPTMTGDFGTVQMDPADKAMYGADGKIKVGTNLMGEDGNISGEASSSSAGSGPSSQLLTSLNTKLDQLLVVNKRIAEVSGNRKQDNITLEMFGDKVGKGVQKAERIMN